MLRITSVCKQASDLDTSVEQVSSNVCVSCARSLSGRFLWKFIIYETVASSGKASVLNIDFYEWLDIARGN